MKAKNYLFGLIILIAALGLYYYTFNNNELRTIRSEKQLYQFYDDGEFNSLSFIEKVLYLPFSLFTESHPIYYTYGEKAWNDIDVYEESDVKINDAASSKDYSKTNIQVEGVDEADIIKTDGDYIYSISGKNIIITNVKDNESIKVESIIKDTEIPNDMILYKDTLVIFSTNEYNIHYSNNTIVHIYDIKNKSNPTLLKSFELEEPYFTTRCIDGNLYVFSSGYLKAEDKKVSRNYKEDNQTKTFPLDDIYYLKNHKSSIQTVIAEVDLKNIKDVRVHSYLIDITDAYISENNIYLASRSYENDELQIKDLFGLKGVIGLFEKIDSTYDSKTELYKFKINSKTGISYVAHKKVDGSIINQYSMDEKNGNLRIALEEDKGTRIEVLGEKLQVVGKTEPVAPGENMYASRFMGDKAYLVTYQNMDPLFVIDLKDEKNPKVMGELKIPGYSTYLHPYDENHLIGIGIDTEETIVRDDEGKVINSRAYKTGMKMSLFDVSDINNPKELATTTIGDSRTVSAILTNPKALLFSKEKNLLAIPVNRYKDEILIQDDEESIYNNYYVGEGYFVYHIDLDGFKLKGIINHDKVESRYGTYGSKLLRGIYIDDNLYTVSESAIKVNKLDDLTEIKEIKLTEEGVLK